MAGRGAARNRVRIIGGEHRGRLVSFPDGEGLRPTADRIRETVFNWLQPVIVGARCLDLFAGSGALGFEAASRGASRVVMIEKASKTARCLRDNVALLGLSDHVEVVQSDALRWLEGEATSFDILFVDPPFADGLVPQIMALLARGGWVAAGGYVYVEQDLRQALPALPQGWELVRDKRSGQVAYRLIKVEARMENSEA